MIADLWMCNGFVILTLHNFIQKKDYYCVYSCVAFDIHIKKQVFKSFSCLKKAILKKLLKKISMRQSRQNCQQSNKSILP